MSQKNRSLKRRGKKFIRDVVIHTPVIKMVILLVALWMLFSAGIFFAEQGAEGSTITSYGKALYWEIAAFSTAGIADMPINSLSEVIDAIWIVVGSLLFFRGNCGHGYRLFHEPLAAPLEADYQYH